MSKEQSYLSNAHYWSSQGLKASSSSRLSQQRISERHSLVAEFSRCLQWRFYHLGYPVVGTGLCFCDRCLSDWVWRNLWWQNFSHPFSRQHLSEVFSYSSAQVYCSFASDSFVGFSLDGPSYPNFLWQWSCCCCYQFWEDKWPIHGNNFV